MRSNGWLIAKVCFLLVNAIACCANSQTVDSMATLDVRCKLLRLDSDFFEQFDYSLSNPNENTFRLTEIETYFLFKLNKQRQPVWKNISPKRKTVIHDFVATKGNLKKVTLSWKPKPNSANFELTITPLGKSAFKMGAETKAEIPDGGSIILRSKNQDEDGEIDYLWIAVRASTKSK